MQYAEMCQNNRPKNFNYWSTSKDVHQKNVLPVSEETGPMERRNIESH